MQPAKRRAQVDVLGGVLCVLGLGGPVFALIEEPQRGFGDPIILVSLIGGVVLFGLFVLWESARPRRCCPCASSRPRNFSFANLETLAVYAGLSTLTFFLVLFLQQLAGYPLYERAGARADHDRDVPALAARRTPVDAARAAAGSWGSARHRAPAGAHRR